ncbi:MAG TPA: hypothetical protein VGS21_01450 [Acidimicrobiales bacterium]|nr:hypothetical protein [Acidimicrobiales bacterium]
MSNNTVAAGRGWPYDSFYGGVDQMPQRPFIGGEVGQGVTPVLYSVTGARVGTVYMDAGLLVTYESGGRTYRTTLWAGGIVCVAPSLSSAESSACAAANDATLRLIGQLAGDS